MLNTPVTDAPPPYAPQNHNQVKPVGPTGVIHQPAPQHFAHQNPQQNFAAPITHQQNFGPPQNFAPGPDHPQPGFAPVPVHFMAGGDVSSCTESTLTTCPNCKLFGMTRIERSFGVCQLICGILMICSLYLMLFGILVLVLAKNYDHYCARCNFKIGTKESCCC